MSGFATIVDPGEYCIFRSTERPWLTCTPDRLIYDGNRLVAELSIKCAWYEAAKEWAQRVPLEHQIQAQQTMYVLGVDTVYYAVLLNGYSFRWYTINRNERWLAKMLPRLDAFWESIQKGEYPNVDESEATARSLAQRFPTPTAGHIELPDTLTELGDEYDQILASEREAAKRKTLIQNIVKEAIGERTVGVLSDGSGFSWAANGKGTRTLRRVEKVRDIDGRSN
jgi:predicted phage-related endonuclease